uniref:HD domain-containing protein n=1 Tax=Pavo cristatus TaxID=9049 RepID=A0A8C9G1I7_PAVCR
GVPRTGWVYRNVAKPESVSDHMYRMAMMALVTEDKKLQAQSVGSQLYPVNILFHWKVRRGKVSFSYNKIDSHQAL